MAANRILKLSIWILSAPLLAISRLVEVFSGDQFRSDLRLCLRTIDQFDDHVPRVFVDALVLAEDHRSNLHFGVDPIAIMRALFVLVYAGRCQGASTIEQQFARVVTGRYEWTLSRKVREQLLAAAIARHKSKEAIASAYLSVAFYGSGCIGIDGLRKRFGQRLNGVDAKLALAFVARLKYPRPLRPNADWHRNIEKRIGQLSHRERRMHRSILKGAESPQFATTVND